MRFEPTIILAVPALFLSNVVLAHALDPRRDQVDAPPAGLR